MNLRHVRDYRSHTLQQVRVPFVINQFQYHDDLQLDVCISMNFIHAVGKDTSNSTSTYLHLYPHRFQRKCDSTCRFMPDEKVPHTFSTGLNSTCQRDDAWPFFQYVTNVFNKRSASRALKAFDRCQIHRNQPQITIHTRLQILENKIGK